MQFKVTAWATLVTALLLGCATVLVAISLRDQAERRSIDESRISYVCTVDGCTEVEDGKRFTPNHSISFIGYETGEVRPALSAWPFSSPENVTYEVHGRPRLTNARPGVERAQQTLNGSILLVAGIALSVTTLVGFMTWAAAVRVLAPVEEMRGEMADINEQNLTRRIRVPSGDNEITRLATTMNETLDRVHKAVEDTRRFVADASHELRSPLAALRAELEIAVSHPQLADWPTVVGNALEDTERLQELTTDLLLLARLDADATEKQDAVDLTAVVQREILRRRVSDVELIADVEARPVHVAGRRAQLSRLLGNLLDNAERHASSTVTVRLRGGPLAVLEVTDDGPGIAQPDRERVFERFTRLDDARTRDAGGAGLGLAIARRIASRHRGTLEAADTADFRGIRFVATIPTGEPVQQRRVVAPPQRTGDEIWQFINGSFVATHAVIPEPRPEPVVDLDAELALIFGEHVPVLTH
ncbi:hypothetical protein Lesp02_54960 [Lentzea sp. NBRC 105346]|nr:hypothetical protein Lesp02_54960 [Lentzea sp. NBRC 105346]